MVAPLSEAILSPAHACRLGVLATLVDVAGSDPVLAAWSPDWTATQDLSLHSASLLSEGPIVVDANVLRRGRKVTFLTADIYDSHGIGDFEKLQSAIDSMGNGKSKLKRVATSLVTFTRISRSGASGVDAYNPNNWLGVIRKRSSGTQNTLPLYERIGLAIIDEAAGVVELKISSYVANSIGTINGGVQAVMLEAAAEVMCPDRVVADMQIHFVSQMKVGPARTRSRVIREADDHTVMSIQLVDSGAEDRILATAVLTLQ